MKCNAYIDGSSLGNPGEAGYGVVFYEKENASNCVKASGVYIGKGTNNTAEYSGLVGCLEMCEDLGVTELHVRSDSELLVKQIHGQYKVKQPHLIKLYTEIFSLIQRQGIDFTIEHVPREQNKEADKLAKQAATLKENIEGL